MTHLDIDLDTADRAALLSAIAYLRAQVEAGQRSVAYVRASFDGMIAAQANLIADGNLHAESWASGVQSARHYLDLIDASLGTKKSDPA
jgi:hypothetical protein